MKADDVKRLKELERENRELKQIDVWALDFQHDATDDGRELKFPTRC